MRKPVLAAIVLWPLSAAAGPAWLEAEDPSDPYALPDAPAPPTLPDLTHRAIVASIDSTYARIQVRAPGTGTDAKPADVFVERLEAEYALAMRRWYVGLAEAAAASTAPGPGFLWVASQPEIWGRAVWASPAGIAYGGGLGFVAPLFTHGDAGTRATESVRVVRPWDEVAFLNHTWTLRPFIDVRQIDGPIILQLRQGLDWAIATGSGEGATDPVSAAIAGETQVTTRTTLFIGYRPMSVLGMGLELCEVYVIRPAPLQGATYVLSPSVHLMTPVLQPAISFLAPVDRPLAGSVDAFWAVRLSFSVVIDPRAR
jgi:hypothetical protein